MGGGVSDDTDDSQAGKRELSLSLSQAGLTIEGPPDGHRISTKLVNNRMATVAQPFVVATSMEWFAFYSRRAF